MEQFFSKLTLDIVLAVLIPGASYFYCRQFFHPSKMSDPDRPSMSILLTGILFYVLAMPFMDESFSLFNLTPIFFPRHFKLLFYYFLFPCFSGFGFPKILNWISGKLGRAESSSWNFAFKNLHGAWVQITLKNGKEIYGHFSPGSHCSSELTVGCHIYLRFTFSRVGEESRFIKNNYGVLVMSDEIETVRFFRSPSFKEEILCPKMKKITQDPSLCQIKDPGMEASVTIQPPQKFGKSMKATE